MLGFGDDFDHEITVPGEYASEADAVVFGRSPFVRVRIFNADVADRMFAAANLPTAIEHFYGQDIPSGEAGGKHLYEQWVTLETPAVFLSHELRGDPAFAFHRSMSALNVFLEAFAIAREKDWIRPVSTRELRPTVAIGRLDLEGNWTYQGPMLIHPDAKPSPLGSRPVAQHVEELNQALELILNAAPFIRARQWRAKSGAPQVRRRRGRLDHQLSGRCGDNAVRALGAAASRGRHSASRGRQTTRRATIQDPAYQSTGSAFGWIMGSDLERQPVGRYWVDLYKLRNRVVHGGYQPHDGDAEKAESAYLNLERYVDDRLRAKGKRYPATLSAKLGEGAEVILARLDAQGDAVAAGKLGQLLKSRGDSARAEAAFRRSQEARSLGSVRESRQDAF